MNSSPYHPLRSADGQIRLLILHPALKHDAPIQCVENGAQKQKAYSVLEQSRYYDIQAQIFDGPDKTPRRGWERLPDGWEIIPRKEKPLFRDNKDRNKQSTEPSPSEGQQAVRAEHYIKQRELSPRWSKIWDNLGRAKVVYRAGETAREHRLRNERELLRQRLSRLPYGLPTGNVQLDGTLSH
ncbi:hypothetical protein FVER53590_28999 [Fusarium verticillioides]|nr:hypothetical protein FVER53590_28999 [Fusarium verticillioides]